MAHLGDRKHFIPLASFVIDHLRCKLCHRFMLQPAFFIKDGLTMCCVDPTQTESLNAAISNYNFKLNCGHCDIKDTSFHELTQTH